MNEISTFSWTFDKDVLQYAEAGYRAMGVWRAKLSDYGEARGVELLRDHGIAVSSLSWAGGFTGSDGQRYSESVEDAIEAIHVAAELAADCLILYTGSRLGHTYNHARRMSRNAVGELLPIAESCGVTLAIEPVHPNCGGEWSFLESLETGLKFIDQFDSPWVKLSFDTYHLGQGFTDISCLEDIGHRVAVVRLADGRHAPRGEQNRCLLGTGNIPIAEIVSALVAGGFRGYCEVSLMGEDLEMCTYDEVLSHSRAALAQWIGV